MELRDSNVKRSIERVINTLGTSAKSEFVSYMFENSTQAYAVINAAKIPSKIPKLTPVQSLRTIRYVEPLPS